MDTRIASGYVSISDIAISPNGDGILDAARINLYKSLSEGIISWKVSMLEKETENVVYEFGGTGNTPIPSYLVWDGRRRNGNPVDGEYIARLAIDYEKGNQVRTDSSTPLVVDTTPPQFSFTMKPVPFSPDDDNVDDTITFSFSEIEDATPITEWAIRVFDPYETLFWETSGRGEPARPITWDGRSESGETVQAAEDYPARITMRDSVGNEALIEEVVPVDILVIRDGDTLKIAISSIQFAPNSPDFTKFDAKKAERNMRTLRRLAETLKKYSAYQIRIEGHAVSVYWDDSARAAKEEAEELKPLSKARADAVKEVLVDLGIPAGRMTTAGMGGTQPVVPHGDLENRWKSRRVEFILIK